MNLCSADASVRVGVIGLGRRGRFLLERWLPHDRVQVVAACDVDSQARAIAMPLCRQVVADAGSLLTHDGVDVVLLALPLAERAALAQQVLSAGRPVVFADPPIAADLQRAVALVESARSGGSRLAVWSPWRENPDFQAALATAQSEAPGPLRCVRYERWSAANLECRTEPSADIGELPRSVVYVFDQLIALAAAAPTRIMARPVGSGLTAIVEFAAGPTATITLHPRSAMNLDSGWAFDAVRGGYAAGRRWVRTADGEVYDVPAEPTKPPTLEDLLRSLLAGEAAAESLSESLRLIALLSACQRSLRTGQAVAIEQSCCPVGQAPA